MNKNIEKTGSFSRVIKPLLRGEMPPPVFVPETLLDGIASFGSARGRFSRLTKIERVIATLRHKEPDHVPCCPIVMGAGRHLIGASYPDFALKPEISARAILAGFKHVGGEIIIPMLDLSVEATDFGQKMVFPENSTPHPDYSEPLLKDASDYRKLKRIDFKSAKRMNSVVEICRLLVKGVKLKGIVSGFLFGPLGVLNMMRGTEFLFRDCINNKGEVKAALEIITEVLIEFAEAQCDTGVPIVTIDTLFASWNGLSKELWEDIEGPFARELANAIHKKGCLVAIHNCGDGIYFDSQIQYMEPAAISFAGLPDDCSSNIELKKRYGDQVVLIGYIDTALLSYGTQEEVMHECRMLIDELADGGGFVLAPACEYPPNIPLDNAKALLKAARLYG